MYRWKRILLTLSALLLASTAAVAEVVVPSPLEPWRDWVLFQHPERDCPRHYASLGEQVCRWPGSLLVEADNNGATFVQDWRLYAETWIDLPGDARHWPQSVRANDRSVAVMEREGKPAIRLPAGEYRIQGMIRWDSLPTRLALPPDTGLLSVNLQGKAVPMPSIDEQGRLLFGENKAPETVADSLSVQVFRQLQDDIPLQLETVVRFRVAGRDRELLLGQFLPDAFVPLALDTALPARIEPDGRLRVQLRAGEWELRLRARAEAGPTQFTARKMDELWPAEEVWSLRDNRSLRQITAAGPASIDPSQTDMPAEWREFPAWLLRDGETLTLSEQQRGETLTEAAAAGEELELVRDLWIDFDGQGVTSRDVVSGVLKQAARFSTAPGQALGRVEVDGEPQLITRLDGDQNEAGIELRPGPLNLMSLSRLTQATHWTVTGWQRDFHRVSATLHLPPGWMLLHAAGADSAQGAWLPRWNLWAIFLVLIVAAASRHLLGWKAGLMALGALLLTYHTAHAPVFLWLAALVGVALARLLPTGRFSRWLALYNGAVFVVLAVVLLQFAVDQARRSLYPQLERGPHMTIQQPVARQVSQAAASAPVEALSMVRESAEGDRDGAYDMAASPEPVARKKLKTGYDTGAKVQTGPGEPAWQWQPVALGWSGPVMQEQAVRLYLMSPAWHRLWNLASVVLVFGFALLLLRAVWPAARLRWGFGRAATPVLLILLSSLGHSPEALAQVPAAANSGFPDQALLQELEQRLTRLPDCEPQCAAFQRGLLQVDDSQLRLDLQIDAHETVAVPLPVARNQWQPRAVLVDGEMADSLRRDSSGQLWTVLLPGSHRLQLEGVLTGDNLSLPFEMPVHNLSVDASGWQVSGLSRDGQVPGRSLQLQRDARPVAGGDPGGAESVQLLPEPAPPFVRVTRTLVLGLEWQVRTRVDRLAPASGAIALPVSLLAGEAVLTPGVDVRNGRVQVVMSANSPSFSWHSSLKQTGSLTLAAANSVPWVEHWQFDIAPIWHVEFAGLNPVKQDMQAGQLPLWQPWPGEQLTATISRPEAVSGSTRTIESVMLDYRPGARSADASLTLQVRSSQGGELPLALPPSSRLQRIVIDGVEQSNPDAEALRLPLRPGNQRIDVSWRQDAGISWREFTPLPQLGEPLSNIELRLHLPQGRWLLAVGGPAMGPALLFWGVLLVIVLVALLLGRSGIAPLATWQWLLLGIGMSTVNSVGSLLVVAWFIAMAKRSSLDTRRLGVSQLQWLQVGLVLLSLLALGSLVGTIPMSLLSSPDMQVVGNQSSGWDLQWYQDRMAAGLPQAWVISLPMWVYRAAMLLWSLWLVFALIGWCRWGWQAFSAGELWRSPPPKQPPAPEGMTLDEELTK